MYIDRTELRMRIAVTEGFQGLVGAISCDALGDCCNGGTNVCRHTDATIADPAALQAVYRFAA